MKGVICNGTPADITDLLSNVIKEIEKELEDAIELH